MVTMEHRPPGLIRVGSDDTLTPNLGVNGTEYLQVEYLRNGVT